MFVKMFKYDFKATWGLLGLLSVIALGVGAMGSVVVRLLEQGYSGFLQTMLIVAMITVVFYLVGYCLAAMLLLLGRFYKSRFTDEGYMTFTLPVTNHQVLLSSFLNCTLGLILCMFITVVSFGILAFFGSSELDGSRWVFVKTCFDYLPRFIREIGGGRILLFLLMLLAGFLSEILTIMLAITLGSIIAKKHRLLVGVMAYYGIHMLITIGSATIMASIVFDNVMNRAGFNAFVGWMIAGYGAVSLICYFVMYWLTSRKLNLN